MSTNEIVGTVIVVGVPLIVGIIALVKPIINLNTSITELNVTIKQLTKDNADINDTLETHTEELADHEKRIYLMEHRTDDGK